MANQRTKGHAGERYYVKRLKEICDLLFAKTSRYASRLLDDCKIDIAGIPLNIQIKTGAHVGLSSAKELSEMERLLKVNYPPEDPLHTYLRILIHKKSETSVKKVDTPDCQWVWMSQKTFYLLNEKLSEDTFDFLVARKTSKSAPFKNTEYGTMVAVRYTEFENKILIPKTYLKCCT
jgi:hypothetical protein